MSEIINASFFDPIVPYIRELSNEGWIRIDIPLSLALDIQEISKYMEDNVTLNYVRGSHTELMGFLKDKTLIDYLFNKMMITEIKWL
jgi:hypothetical protein